MWLLGLIQLCVRVQLHGKSKVLSFTIDFRLCSQQWFFLCTSCVYYKRFVGASNSITQFHCYFDEHWKVLMQIFTQFNQIFAPTHMSIFSNTVSVYIFWTTKNEERKYIVKQPKQQQYQQQQPKSMLTKCLAWMKIQKAAHQCSFEICLVTNRNPNTSTRRHT